MPITGLVFIDISIFNLPTREADAERSRIEQERLPEFFTHSNVIPFRKPIQKEKFEIPIVSQTESKKQPIGFVQYDELKRPSSKFEPNVEARSQAIQTAKAFVEEHGRLPKQMELVNKGISRHYASLAIKALKEE